MLRAFLGWRRLRLLSRMCFAVCRWLLSCCADTAGGRCSRLLWLRCAVGWRGMVTAEPPGRWVGAMEVGRMRAGACFGVFGA